MIEVTNGMVMNSKALVTFDGKTVRIKRGTFGRTEVRIPVSRITQVGWSRRVISQPNHIEFVAAGVDGTVKFRHGHLKEFEQLRDAVENAMTVVSQ